MLHGRISLCLVMAFLLPCSVLTIQASQASDDLAHEFEFARLVYGNSDLSFRSRWQVDWPSAEQHFLQGMKRLTRLDVGIDGVLVELTQDDLFDYPWLYAVEVGHLVLSSEEAQQLREYLLRGGFLMVDDFHGYYEWQQFEFTMSQVFPDRGIVDVPVNAEPYHVLYDLSERQQIPSINSVASNQTWERDGKFPRWRGIHDDEGRVMVIINFNQDLGDAWEHADEPFYPQPYTAMAYRFGINYVLYAMTH